MNSKSGDLRQLNDQNPKFRAQNSNYGPGSKNIEGFHYFL